MYFIYKEITFKNDWDWEIEFLTSVTPASKMVSPASFSSAAFWLTDYIHSKRVSQEIFTPCTQSAKVCMQAYVYNSYQPHWQWQLSWYSDRYCGPGMSQLDQQHCVYSQTEGTGHLALYIKCNNKV